MFKFLFKAILLDLDKTIPTFELEFKCIKDEIGNEFRRHSHILESKKLKDEKEEYKNIRIINLKLNIIINNDIITLIKGGTLNDS